jgi:hypothetical protein
MIAWIRLKFLELRLMNEFGKHNKYLYEALERNAKTARQRLVVALEVLSGPGVNSLEAWGYAIALEKKP